MKTVWWTLALVALTPAVALACPTCISSAWGDRTYNWAYFGLLLMPFVLTATVGGILAYRAGWRLRLPRFLPPFRRTDLPPFDRSKETT